MKDLVTEQRFNHWTKSEGNLVIVGVNNCKQEDEGDYRVVLANDHGEEEYEFQLYVTVAGGMDFRAMLMKKKKPPKKVQAPPIEWIEKLVDVKVQEGKEDKVVLGAKLSEKGKVGKWFLRNEVRPLSTQR